MYTDGPVLFKGIVLRYIRAIFRNLSDCTCRVRVQLAYTLHSFSVKLVSMYSLEQEKLHCARFVVSKYSPYINS